ncbi:hypothetical protein [Sinomonas atrocyanea]
MILVDGIRAFRAAVALVVGCSVLAGCGSGLSAQPARTDPPGQNMTLRSKRPDPSSTEARPLANLLSDPVFASLPPGSTKTGEQKDAAHNDPVIFGSGGTFGASYEIDFTSTAPASDVYADLDRRARAAGWDAVAKDSDGRTAQWVKAYPDWSKGDLAVERLNPEKAAPPYMYSLVGSI